MSDSFIPESRNMKTIDLLFEETGFTIEDVAEQAKLTPERVESIALGRWTPSPNERRRMAAVFGVAPDEISWGHNIDPRNIRYRQFGFKEKPKLADVDEQSSENSSEGNTP